MASSCSLSPWSLLSIFLTALPKRGQFEKHTEFLSERKFEIVLHTDRIGLSMILPLSIFMRRIRIVILVTNCHHHNPYQKPQDPSYHDQLNH